MNELIFVLYVLTVSSAAVLSLKISKEALIALICLQCVLVNLFVTKEITLFGLSATASDALAVGTTLALNLLQEYYHRPITQKAIWISFFCAIFYTIVSLLHLAYTPVAGNVAAIHFKVLLSPMPRLIAASLIVYLLVQHVDCRLYGYLCKRFEYKHFLLRNYSSVAITQLLDTVLFTFLGLYGISENYSNLSTLLQIIVVSYFIKLIVILIAAPYITITKRLIKS